MAVVEELNPLSQVYSMDLAQALFFAGRRDEAFAALNRARDEFRSSTRASHSLPR